MAELLKCKAIILSETDYNENDKMLTALSDEFGKISISAKGSKRPNSKFLASSQQFCYSEMQLTQSKNGIYNLCESELIESFYGLRNDLDYLMAANAISKKVLKISQEELSDPQLLRLLLNTLFILSDLKHKISLVTAAFDIRAVFDQGYLKTPENCKAGTSIAINYIINSDYKKLFSFDVSDEVLKELCKIAEKQMNYLLQM